MNLKDAINTVKAVRFMHIADRAKQGVVDTTESGFNEAIITLLEHAEASNNAKTDPAATKPFTMPKKAPKIEIE
jgi:hypothetical protein